MEDEIWLLTQKLREIKEYRLDTRVAWDDEAAYEINGRYLNPLESDADEMIAELNQQMELLQQVDEKLIHASRLAHTAEKLSKEAARHLQEADDMSLTVYKYLDLFVQHNVEALNIIPKVYQLVAQANAACKD